MTSTTRSTFVCLAAFVFACGFLTPIPASAGNNWPHYAFDSVATGLDPFDMAKKPGGNIIGLAMFNSDGLAAILKYYEYDPSTGTATGGVVVTLPGVSNGDDPFSAQYGLGNGYEQWNIPSSVSISYASANRVGIAYTHVVNVVYHCTYTELCYVEGNYSSGSGWTWLETQKLDYELPHAEYPTPDLASFPGFGHVDVAFDLRTGFTNIVYITYTGEWPYVTLAEALELIPARYYTGILYQRLYSTPGSEAVPTAPPEDLRPIPFYTEDPQFFDNVDTSKWLISHVWPPSTEAKGGCRASLATSTSRPPQIVFDWVSLTTEWYVIEHSTWSDALETWGTPVGVCWGAYPSLALNPSNGNPRVAFDAHYSDGDYFTWSNDGGATWNTPVIINSDAGWSVLDVGLTTGGTEVIKACYTDVSTGNIYGAKCSYPGGAWSSVTYPIVMHGSADTSEHPVLVNPGATTDPWVLCTDQANNLGLAWNGPSQDCGTAPVAREEAAGVSAGKALIPAGAALAAVACWYMARRRRRSSAAAR